uniref:Uncharacterized protein n=1 Tax=Arundo donax TaxID=35708 RepID=A0A0A8Z2Q6_ARUDO
MLHSCTHYFWSATS